MIAPCKGCKERRPLCHSFCEKYLKYREYIDSHHSNFTAYIDAEDIDAHRRKMTEIERKVRYGKK